jgi:hypothetical protein
MLDRQPQEPATTEATRHALDMLDTRQIQVKRVEQLTVELRQPTMSHG